MESSEPLACTLSGPELVERIAEWRHIASHATSRHVEKGRVVSIYPPDRELLRQLRKLIAAEAQCCSFMRFNLEERPDHVEVELTVPHDMSEVFAVMLGLVDRPSPSAQQTAEI